MCAACNALKITCWLYSYAEQHEHCAEAASSDQPSQPFEALPRAEDLPQLFLFVGILSGEAGVVAHRDVLMRARLPPRLENV